LQEARASATVQSPLRQQQDSLTVVELSDDGTDDDDVNESNEDARLVISVCFDGICNQAEQQLMLEDNRLQELLRFSHSGRFPSQQTTNATDTTYTTDTSISSIPISSHTTDTSALPGVEHLRRSVEAVSQRISCNSIHKSMSSKAMLSCRAELYN